MIRLAGLLPGTSHLTDGTYAIVIGDWETADTVATVSGQGFVYRNLGPPGYHPIDLGNPDGFVAEVLAMKKANPGVDGIFLDNLNSWDRSTQLPFLQAVAPRLKAAGLLLMANAMANSSSMGGLDQNDGSADRAWYAEIAPYLTHIFIEYWEMNRDGSGKLRHSGTASYQDNWEGWQKNPGAIHDLGLIPVADGYMTMANAIYQRASWLLVAPPGAVYAHSFASTTVPEGPDPYNAAWMKDMGAPIDPPGSNPRRFQNGVVTVDPVAGTATIT